MPRIRVVVQVDNGEEGMYGEELTIVDDELRLMDLSGPPRVSVIPLNRLVKVEIIVGSQTIGAD